MSRPFSYNDENFTVIGNVLFCHIKIKNQVLKNEPIVEIPPEIYARMLFYSQKFNEVQNVVNVVSSSDVIVAVGVNKEGDKKYFLFSNKDIYEKNLYLVGYFILKDI